MLIILYILPPKRLGVPLKLLVILTLNFQTELPQRKCINLFQKIRFRYPMQTVLEYLIFHAWNAISFFFFFLRRWCGWVGGRGGGGGGGGKKKYMRPRSLFSRPNCLCLLQSAGYPKRDKREPLPYLVAVQADLSLCWLYKSSFRIYRALVCF